MKEITCYNDYANLTGIDLVNFMKEQSREDIEEFKAFCATPKITHYKDGTTAEHKTSFFEMRNWILDKYYPGVRVPKKKSTSSLFDMIMEL